MRKLLDVEGSVIGFLEKCGQLILLSVLWVLGCIPLFTVCASTAALYDAVMQTVRGGEGKTAAVFWECFKRSFPSGCLLSLLLALGFAVPEGICVFLLKRTYPGGLLGALMVLNLFVSLYAPAVLAKFRRGAVETWKPDPWRHDCCSDAGDLPPAVSGRPGWLLRLIARPFEVIAISSQPAPNRVRAVLKVQLYA